MRLLINDKNIDILLEYYQYHENKNQIKFINNEFNIKVIFDLLSKSMTIIFMDSKSFITYNIDTYLLIFTEDIEEIKLDKLYDAPKFRLCDNLVSNYTGGRYRGRN